MEDTNGSLLAWQASDRDLEWYRYYQFVYELLLFPESVLATLLSLGVFSLLDGALEHGPLSGHTLLLPWMLMFFLNQNTIFKMKMAFAWVSLGVVIAGAAWFLCHWLATAGLFAVGILLWFGISREIRSVNWLSGQIANDNLSRPDAWLRTKPILRSSFKTFNFLYK